MFHTTTKQKLRNPRVVAADRKLDSAIRKSTITYWIDQLNSNKDNYEANMVKTFMPHYQTAETSPDMTATIISDILDGNNTHTGKVRVEPGRVFELIRKNLKLQHDSINRNNKTKAAPALNTKFQDYLRRITPSTEIYDFMIWSHELSYIVERLANCRKYPRKGMTEAESIAIDLPRQTHENNDIYMKCMWTTQLIVVTYRERTWLLPKESFLQLHNKVCDLLSVLVLVKMESGVSLEQDAYRLTKKFVRSLCGLLVRYQDKYFSISASLEGLCTGEILMRAEDWVNDDLIKVLARELSDTIGFDYMGSHIRHILQESSIPLIAELSCLSKIPGHPHVDLEGGLEKVHRRANEPIDINVAAVGYCIASIKESFILNFIKRHHRWPNVALEPSIHPGLRTAWAKNITPNSPVIIRDFGEIDTLEWHNVELGPEITFQYLDNMIPYLQDKVISVTRSRVVGVFLGQDKIKIEEKRLLLHYLLHDQIDLQHREFIDKYVDSEEGMEDVMDYLVVRLCPKEKEHRNLARMYGCMTYMNRCRMLAQEKNVMHYLDLYSDEQAMTLSEFRMVKKLQSFRHLGKAYSAMVVFMFNCDASGWCGRFRHAAVFPPLHFTLDKIFDKKIFSRTQEWYENTLFYADDPVHAQYWEGQRGGIEGLSQDTWVVLYTAQIKFAFKDTNYKIHVLCKGDDLRVAVAVPKIDLEGVDRRDFVKGLMTRISRAASLFGHDMKIQESYASETFMSFSKQYSLDDIELTSQFRKIQKCYGSNNAILPTLDEYIGSSFANAHSACYAGINHYSCYVVALMWSYQYLLISKDPAFGSLPENELVCSLLIPSCAGGFPMIFLHNMFVRAESDLLSAFVDLAFFCRSYHHGYWRVFSRIINQSMVELNNQKILVLDPYGLPLTKPSSAKSFLRKNVRSILTQITVNEPIRELLRRFDDKVRDRFFSCLTSTADEIQARIINAIYSASPFAHIDELVSRFDSSKSIWQLLIYGNKIRSATSLMRRAIKLDRDVCQWRYNLLDGSSRRTHNVYNMQEPCPMKFTLDWRTACYGKKVITVTNPPLAHYLSFVSPSEITTTDHEQLNHFVYELTPVTQRIKGTKPGDQFTAGKEVAFLGQKTSTGTDEPAIHIIEKNPVLSKIKQALLLYGWCNVEGSNVPDLMAKLMACYTSTPIEDLAPYQPRRKSGTATHHIRSSTFRESIVPNNRSNIYTQIKSESKTHVTFKGSSEHHNVNFLHIMCMSTCLMTMELEVSPSMTQSRLMWCVTNDCVHCNKPIEEQPIVMKDDVFMNLQLPEIKAMHIGKEAEAILRGEIIRFNLAQEKLRPPVEGTQIYTLEEASTAIVQSFLSNVFHHTEELQHRYRLQNATKEVIDLFNNLSSGGTHKNISLTEMKKIDPTEILASMEPLIVGYCLRTFKKLEPASIDSIIMRQPPGTLPWSFALTILERAGLLAGIINAASVYYQLSPPMCFLSAESSSKFLAIAMCHNYFSSDSYTFRIYYSSFEDNDRIRSRILAMETVFKKSVVGMIWTETLDLGPCTGKKKNIEEEDSFDAWKRIISQMMTVMLAPLNDTVQNTEFAVGETHSFVLLDFEAVTLRDIGQVLNEDWSYYGWFRHLVQSTSKCDIWAITSLLEDNDIYDAANTIQLFVGEISIEATSIDIASCSSLIRSTPLKEEYDAPFIIPENDYDCPLIQNIQGNCRKMPNDVNNILPDPNPPAPEEYIAHIPFVDMTYFTRWAGDGVSSQAKMAEILTRCRINLHQRKGLVFTLGEGMGGISRFILENSKSKVVFNSLETEDNVPARPEIVLLEKSLRNRIYFDHTKRGINDLRNQTTYDILKSVYPENAWLITCDAELDVSNIGNFAIWRNVARFYLEKRTKNGILVMKVYSNHTTVTAQICTLLKHHCEKVFLYRCYSSHVGYECYIVAQGTLRIPLFGQLLGLPIPHPTVHARCTALNVLIRDRNIRAGHFAYHMSQEEQIYVSMCMGNFVLTPNTLKVSLSTILQISQHKLKLISARTPPITIPELLGLYHQLHNLLSGLTFPVESKRASEHLDTLAHHYRVIEFSMALTGFMCQLEQGSRRYPINPQDWILYYQTHCPLDRRYQIVLHADPDGSLRIDHVETCMFHGASHVKQGIETAFRLYGWIEHLKFGEF